MATKNFTLSLLATALCTTGMAGAQETDAGSRATQQEVEVEAAARTEAAAQAEAAARAERAARVRQEEAIVRGQERERARLELQEAQLQLERAARELALVSQQNAGNQARTGLVVDQAFGPRWPTQIGARVTPAEGGALVTQVTPGGPADVAGIKVGDVVQRVGDVSLAADADLDAAAVGTLFREALAAIEPGSSIPVVVERAGTTLELAVEPASASDFSFTLLEPFEQQLEAINDHLVGLHVTVPGQDITASVAPAVNLFRTFSFTRSPWGDMELVPITEGLGRYFDTDQGLLVVSAPEDEAIGIEDGDVILSISGRTPNSPEHAIRILSSFEPGETIEFSLMRNGRRDSVDYQVPESDSGFTRTPVRVLPTPD